MPKYPSISIFLAVRNQRDYVKTAIESVLRQTSDDWELVVVDDGSEDGTREVLREYTDSRIHTYRLSNSRGKAKCLNEALIRSTGRLLLELDGDDWLEPTAVEEIIELAEDWPNDVACIYGNVRTHVQRDGRTIPLFVQKGRPYKDKYDFLLNCDFFAPRIWKRSAVESVSGWPQDSRTFNEGRIREAHGLAIRLLAQYKIVYRDFTVYNYRKHKESLTARYGRKNSWLTKKQDIVTALELWQAPYTPFFDDLLHLIFLRPNKAPESTQSSHSPMSSQAMQTTKQPTRHKTGQPIIIDTTKEKQLKPEPELIDVSETSSPSPQTVKQHEQNTEKRTPKMPKITKPSALHLPGFPSAVSAAEKATLNVTKPQAINWFQLRAYKSQEDNPRTDSSSFHSNKINETSSSWEQKDHPTANRWNLPLFFCPIGSVETNGEQGRLHTRFANLISHYLAKELGGTVLADTITLREAQSDSTYGGTYVDSPSSIQERILAIIKKLPAEALLVIVPGLSNNRTVHLLRTALPAELVDAFILVINPSHTLMDAGIAETTPAKENWIPAAIRFLEYTLDISSTSPEANLARHFVRLIERVSTEVKLAIRRRQIK